MYDRIPSPGKENRVSITQDNGQVITGVLAYADDATQEGSQYTKGNVLPDAVLSLIGLPTESSEPADMFNVLATAGDLHVWRRTKQTSETVPTTYELQEINYDGILMRGVYANCEGTIDVSDSVTVNTAGVVSLVSPENVEINSSAGQSGLPDIENKFIRFYSLRSGVVGDIPKLKIMFIPNGGSLQLITDGQIVQISEYQYVTGVPEIPPGTDIDYPVSVNPNAYQTGSDAQPAGYTLGAVQSGNFVFAQKVYYGMQENCVFGYSDSVTVSNDGSVSLNNPSTYTANAPSSSEANLISSAFKGKFFEYRAGGFSSFKTNEIYYIPNSASFEFNDASSPYNDSVNVNQYQTVTGYPATPAGVTIEYLGKLGDKARMQIVSYIGTGTYGASNPCSITADFPIESATYLGSILSDGVWSEPSTGILNVVSSTLSTSYKNKIGFLSGSGTQSAKISSDRKKISWYVSSGVASNQINISGATNYFLCRG